MDISVGIIACNEEQNIGALLGRVKEEKAEGLPIKDIIVVSSSTDATNDIVKAQGGATLIEQERCGKASAVNEFLGAASGDVLVLCSGDVLPEPGAIQKLCKCMEGESIGIAACRPVPAKAGSYLCRIIQYQWELHHRLSEIEPKFGEMIAFKKVMDSIGPTAADEEYIAMLVKNNGMNSVYVEDAVVANKGPTTLSEFIRQRRRIHWGHLKLKQMGYRPCSLSTARIIKQAPIRLTAIPSACLELYARFLALLDLHSGREHYSWK